MKLDDTQERALPEHQDQTLEDYLVFLKHTALYEYAQSFCQSKIILDLGCGEGYGGRMLARAARRVVGADYSFSAVAHARQKYATPNLDFVVCDAQALPFRADCFEATTSFEVIEHLPEPGKFLNEIKRVCAGTILISTPNRKLRLLPFQRPWNQYHRREYAARDLRAALTAAYAQVQMSGIAGIPAIMQIEKARVRQKPWVAYPRMLAQLLFPRAWYAALKRHKPAAPVTAPRAPLTPKFSVDDFFISSNALDESINLLAVCQR